MQVSDIETDNMGNSNEIKERVMVKEISKLTGKK